jgi:hypothetical protein
MNNPVVHGDERTPPTRPRTTWAEVEALAAILEPEAFDLDQAADETWRKVTQNRALAHAAKVITSGYLKVEPDVRVFELKPDDVVLIGNVHGGQGPIRAFMDWAKDEWSGRKVVCFSDDRDVQALSIDDECLLAVARAIRDAYERLPDGSAPEFTEPHEWLAEARAALAALRGSASGGGNATK